MITFDIVSGLSRAFHIIAQLRKRVCATAGCNLPLAVAPSRVCIFLNNLGYTLAAPVPTGGS